MILKKILQLETRIEREEKLKKAEEHIKKLRKKTHKYMY